MSPPVMNPPYYDIFCGLCDIVKFLCTSDVDIASFDAFYVTMLETLCEFEKEFPPTEHAIVFHLLIEIYKKVKTLGPTFTYWMYVFERYIGTLTRKIHMRTHPEMNLLNVHTIDMALDRLVQIHGDKLFAGLPSALCGRYVSPFLQAAPGRLVHFPLGRRNRGVRVTMNEEFISQLYTAVHEHHPALAQFTPEYISQNLDFLQFF